jgi:ubiquinone/menaquinone biosynthesis C-methylase UbiE
VAGRDVLRRLYDSADPLCRRQAFLERLRTREDSFVDWALDLLPVRGGETVLDAGCGWGRFLLPIARGLRAGGRCFGVDLSAAVMRPAVQLARDERLPAAFALGDIDALPVRDGAVDVVMANHVLYHVANLDHAVAGLRRALKPGGLLMATTNSEAVRPAVLVLHERMQIELGVAAREAEQTSFSMESGLPALRRHFDLVERHFYRDALRFPDADTLVDLYESTGRYRMLSEHPEIDGVTGATLLVRARRLAASMAGADGAIDSPVLMGTFLARAVP